MILGSHWLRREIQDGIELKLFQFFQRWLKSFTSTQKDILLWRETGSSCLFMPSFIASGLKLMIGDFHARNFHEVHITKWNSWNQYRKAFFLNMISWQTETKIITLSNGHDQLNKASKVSCQARFIYFHMHSTGIIWRAFRSDNHKEKTDWPKTLSIAECWLPEEEPIP